MIEFTTVRFLDFEGRSAKFNDIILLKMSKNVFIFKANTCCKKMQFSFFGCTSTTILNSYDTLKKYVSCKILLSFHINYNRNPIINLKSDLHLILSLTALMFNNM